MLDISIMRIQYEILNATVQELAADFEMPVFLVQQEIDRFGWKQRWPELPTLQALADRPSSATDEEIVLSAQDQVSQDMQAYIEDSRRRLQVYALAKARLLAAKYLALECDIIDTARGIIADAGTGLGAQGIKQLSALYKDLTGNGNLASLATMAIGQAEDGLPMVVVRDLSGK